MKNYFEPDTYEKMLNNVEENNQLISLTRNELKNFRNDLWTCREYNPIIEEVYNEVSTGRNTFTKRDISNIETLLHKILPIALSSY